MGIGPDKGNSTILKRTLQKVAHQLGYRITKAIPETGRQPNPYYTGRLGFSQGQSYKSQAEVLSSHPDWDIGSYD